MVRARITKIHGILARLPGYPVAWHCGVIPVAPAAKGKPDPNGILRGPVIGNVPVAPPNLHLDSHWKVGHRASQKRPGLGRTSAGRTAWIQPPVDPGPTVMWSLDSPALDVMGSLDTGGSLD
jgi:hypothetical protein